MYSLPDRRQPGQSMVLLALVMFILIGMVGLSVDVGHAYAQQRRMQNAANAGALTAANSCQKKLKNQQVWANIQTALTGNRVDTDSSNYRYEAAYVRQDGTTQQLAVWNGSGTPTVWNPTGDPPANTARVRVRVTHTVETFFVRVVGQDQFGVTAEADACLGTRGKGLMPIAIPLTFETGRERVFEGWNDNNGDGQPSRTPNPADTLQAEILPTPNDWNVGLINKVIYIPIENGSGGISGSHVGWIDWTPRGGGASELEDALAYPDGTLEQGFEEAFTPKNFIPEEGDWLGIYTGNKAGVADKLLPLLGKEIMLPMWDTATGNGANGRYHWSRTGRFKLIAYEFANGRAKQEGVLPPNTSDNKYLMLQYLGKATVSEGVSTECPSPP